MQKILRKWIFTCKIFILMHIVLMKSFHNIKQILLAVKISTYMKTFPFSSGFIGMTSKTSSTAILKGISVQKNTK